MKTTPRNPLAHLLTAGLLALAAPAALADTVTISSTPLATSGASGILPNLLFVLDASGSMDSNYLPDYVNDSGKCMKTSGGSTTCNVGDAPWDAGGANGFNGVAYDPMVAYKPGLLSTGRSVVNNSTATFGGALTTTAVQNDAYGVQFTGTTNITTSTTDARYCNANNVCKRNGVDNSTVTLLAGTDDQGVAHPAGRFPYRTNNSNASTAIFGLPEMMRLASFSRSGTTVTVTTVATHNLAVNDWIFVTGTGVGSIDLGAVQVASTPTANQFTYTSTASGTQAAVAGSFRKHAAATVDRTAGSTTVTVTSANHGLVGNDIVLVNSSADGTVNSTGRSVTVIDANRFSYTQTGATTTAVAAAAATWVRTGLYNSRGTTSMTANSYSIIPVEYCSDPNLTNCVEVAVGASPPAGFSVPAHVRFCQTQEQALAPRAVSDSSGTPRCRSKWVGSGTTRWTFPRFGYFQRDIIQSGATFARSAARTDCAAAPNCTYAEEIQNYARWWAYYRTRMQMMKTAAGRAFLPFISNPSATPAVPDKLRIGFITINPFYPIGSSTIQTTVQANRYLKIDAFNTTQASSWYTMFYLQDPNQSTPLREALSRAGWIYAGKLNTGLTAGIPTSDDPVQASCQRHFTLLTTDGYWNGNAGQNLQGTAIGNYDNVNPTTDAGYSQVSVDRSTTGTFDGGVGTQVTTNTPTTQLEQVVCQAGNNTTFNGGTQTACGCAAGNHRIKQRTTTQTATVTTTDGIVTSSSPGTPTYTYQDITGCTPALVTTNTTPANRLEQVVCSAGNNTTFGQGTQQACGCGASLKRIKQQTGSRNHVVQTTDGIVTSDTYTAYSYTFQNITACDALVNTTITEMTETQDNRCQGSGNTSFGVSANNGQGGETACGCTGSNRRNFQRTLKYDRTVIQYDGVTTSTTYGATKSQVFTALTACGTSHTSTAAVVNTSAPQPVGYPTVSNTGSTITAAGFTISPNPQINDPAGATVSSSTGSALTITMNPNPSNPVVGTVTTTTVPGGYANTLADVAMYYFRNDLRGGTQIAPTPPLVGGPAPSTGPTTDLGGTGTTDVATNIVPAKSGAKDFVTHQHMVTFSIGLADGFMRYQSDYETASTGDFANVKSGASNTCFWVSGTCNWPQPVADDPSALDDLWHAAVNGRGQFYLALNADALSTGIQSALTAVNAQVAAAAASATSSPNVTQTDNQIFSTTYETNTWSGKVFAQTIDPSTGDVLPAIQWQADQQLIAKVAASTDSRVIWTYDGTSGTLLKPFLWANLTATEQALFLNKCVPASNMTQCTSLTAGQLVTANDGSSLVGYLRGQQGNETTIFRDRTYIDIANNNAVVQTVLGDTISAKPAYLRRPQFNYADVVTPNYSTFFTSNINRSPRVYVAANDGFLHAFHGDTGDEVWAYLPSFLMPGLYALADTGYPSLHRYFADGSPELGEVFDSGAGAWKSILVAGVSGGGRGYYALDVTDPSNPKGLWEFCNDATLCAISDPDLGLTYGNAVIGKLKDGTWVVVVTSGLNNIGPGDGTGYFYILDALTGKILDKVGTKTGDLVTPSGLMKISAFYNSALTDATFVYIYGGDQLGNVWRLDTSTSPATVLHIAQLTDGSSPPRAQPITTRPRLTPLNGYRVLFFGTGRYLGKPDLSDPGAASGISWQQTMYGFKDQDKDYGDLRANGKMVQQKLIQASLGATDRTITSNPVDWNTDDGWYVDFNPQVGGVDTTPGEGVNIVDPVLIQGTVLVITNTPAGGGSSCSVGGSSNKYEFDFKTGSVVSTSAGGVVGRSLGGTITVGVAVVQLPSGAIKAITTGADTSKTTSSVNVSATGAAVRRFSYRVR